jgi:hypothetical protein
MPRKSKIYYLFDINGKYLSTHENTQQVSDLIHTGTDNVRNAVMRKKPIQKKYYVSHDINFKIE